MQKIFKEVDNLQEEINKYRPLSPHLVKQIKEYYRIGLIYTSNALEGNTLTESETKVVLEDGLTVGGRPLRDIFEAIGLSESYDFMYKLAKDKIVTSDHIKELHRMFYYRIDSSNAGIYRDVKVFITGSKYPTANPDKIDILMQKLADNISIWRTTMHPVQLSALVHKEFVFIHPFIDGNGRVARLLMNLILLQESYNIAIIPPIMRTNYFQALELAHINDSEFIKFIAQMLKETQKDYLRLFM